MQALRIQYRRRASTQDRGTLASVETTQDLGVPGALIGMPESRGIPARAFYSPDSIFVARGNAREWFLWSLSSPDLIVNIKRIRRARRKVYRHLARSATPDIPIRAPRNYL